MSRNLVVIFYSPGQSAVREILLPTARSLPDHDEVAVPVRVKQVQPGEAAIVVSLGLYRLLGAEVLVERVTGRRRTSTRCALVDPRGVVVGHLAADPTIDSPHLGGGHTLVADPEGKTVHGQGLHHQSYQPPKVK